MVQHPVWCLTASTCWPPLQHLQALLGPFQCTQSLHSPPPAAPLTSTLSEVLASNAAQGAHALSTPAEALPTLSLPCPTCTLQVRSVCRQQFMARALGNKIATKQQEARQRASPVRSGPAGGQQPGPAAAAGAAYLGGVYQPPAPQPMAVPMPQVGAQVAMWYDQALPWRKATRGGLHLSAFHSAGRGPWGGG
jgi:hypothetical protein